MKRLFLTLLCFLTFCGIADARMLQGVAGAVTKATTNYCNDAATVGCWLMNSVADNNEIDRSSVGNNLIETASDSIARSTTVPAGYSGYSKTFVEANTEFLSEQADGSELDISGADAKVSVCSWVNLSSAVFTSYYGIAGKYSTGSGRQYRLIAYATNTNTVRFDFATSTNSTTDTGLSVSSATLTYKADGTEWHHICGVYDGNNNIIYVDGSYSNKIAHTGGIYNGSQTFQIGASNGTANYANGLIDETIVLSRALSAAEVLDIYTNGIDGTKGGTD